MKMDAQTIMTGRGCVIGQSGSGKSYLMGVIAEELCRANLPFCVIDTEGEYDSLRNNFGVLVVGGEAGDIKLDSDLTSAFAASIGNDIPIVLDVSEELDRKDAVYRALDALYHLASRIRKPYLIMIEEADKLAPQAVGKGINIVEEISIRGRKRGLGLLIATQRPANISKNVLAQCSYGFIGKLTIRNDLNAIRPLFGSGNKLNNITKLRTGEFMPFGLEHEEKFKVKMRQSMHGGETPELVAYEPQNRKLAAIIEQLKKGKVPVKASERAVQTVTIEVIPAQFGLADAQAYAERMARRRFVLFGEATESVDSVKQQYLPVGMCTMRLPTHWKGEYLEYYVFVTGNGDLLSVNNKVRFIGGRSGFKTSERETRSYMARQPVILAEVQVPKDEVPKNDLTAQKALRCLRGFFPDPTLADFRKAYLPFYKITFKKGNRVRIHSIDGIKGERFDIL